jgi:hypothetical protein
VCATRSDETEPRAGPSDTPKQVPVFNNRCNGQIDANDGEGKAGSFKKGQDGGGRAISKVHLTLLLPQTITNSQG